MNRIFRPPFIMGLLLAAVVVAGVVLFSKSAPDSSKVADEKALDSSSPESPSDAPDKDAQLAEGREDKAPPQPDRPSQTQPEEEAAQEHTPAAGRVYIFWGEFSTANQAAAFAQSLTRQSGVDVRAEKTRAGYRVALDFADDSDLDDKIQKIESATGFDIRGSESIRLYVLRGGFSSREEAAQLAETLGRMSDVDVRPVQTPPGFAVGVVYSDEVDLNHAIQAVESSQGARSRE